MIGGWRAWVGLVVVAVLVEGARIDLLSGLELEALGVEGTSHDALAVYRGGREGLIGVWHACDVRAGALGIGGWSGVLQAREGEQEGEQESDQLAESRCFVQGKFSSDLQFRFRFQPPNAAAQSQGDSFSSGASPDLSLLQPPRVSFDAGNSRLGAAPRSHVIDFESDAASASGHFTVRLLCTDAAHTTSKGDVIRFDWALPSGERLSFSWLKVCGAGAHGRIQLIVPYDMGSFTERSTVVSLDSPVPPVAMDHVEETELHIVLQVNGVLQAFLPPNIVSSDERVASVAVFSSAASGSQLWGTRGANQLRQTQTQPSNAFFVLYRCHAPGKVRIHFSIPVPPFDTISGTWEKKCASTSHASSGLGIFANAKITAPGLNPETIILGGQVHAQYADTKYRVGAVSRMGTGMVSFRLPPMKTLQLGSVSIRSSDESRVRCNISVHSDARAFTVSHECVTLNGAASLLVTPTLHSVTAPSQARQFPFSFTVMCLDASHGPLYSDDLVSPAHTIWRILPLGAVVGAAYFVLRRTKSDRVLT
ncbi:hypothetical protein FVE85_4004 [Porphyridium purpureum]|uniref:Uncharacterized protein n=1 Tax=Porphyridium purpureum TaxID=35688 RepID=A0A5J4YRB9_PORPP|nr:hypothetical protein FVE85_4004 [Porphyridium purpureum]|eukprot:POR7471..scf229_5